MSEHQSGDNMQTEVADNGFSTAFPAGARAASDPCPSCGTLPDRVSLGEQTPPFAYAIGSVEYRFPTLALEKELAQAVGRGDESTAGLTDHAVVCRALSDPANRYVARQMCWVLTVEALETYLLIPRDGWELELLLGTLREQPGRSDIDVVIGVRGPVAPAHMCNGLSLPVVFVDQVYSFDTDSLLGAIPRPESIQKQHFEDAAREVFERIGGLADNTGSTDEHRALNYLVVRSPALYGKTAEQFGREFSLTAVDTRRSSLSHGRRIVEVVFSYTNRRTDFTEKFFVRVDVTEEFPFLLTNMSPYYDR
ncbi:MAG: hypothetical protein ACTHMY_22870 [Solirubrobacteraceae bacterium]